MVFLADRYPLLVQLPGCQSGPCSSTDGEDILPTTLPQDTFQARLVGVYVHACPRDSWLHLVSLTDDKTDTCIYQTSVHPPHFKVVRNKTVIEIPKVQYPYQITQPSFMGVLWVFCCVVCYGLFVLYNLRAN